ncbi:MAG: peptidylprolyl isomerase [Phycisphaerae bacterium]|nr:peptidylprolyl isomerase [Phycisphaerae bacterium]
MLKMLSHCRPWGLLVCAGVLLAGPTLAIADDDTTQSQPAAVAKDKDEAPPKGPRVALEIVQGENALGTIVLALNAEKAPISTWNFVKYVDDGYYNGTCFHRVIPDFMIQGGGYDADMGEKREGLRDGIWNEWKNGLSNTRGTIAMARTNEPNSGTSQFYINVADNNGTVKYNLDRPMGGGAAYAVFGKVVEGMDVVEKIRTAETMYHPKYPTPKQHPAVTPTTPIVVKSAKVIGDCNRAALEEMSKSAANAFEAEERAAKAAAAKAEAEQEKIVQEFIANAEKEAGKKSEKTDSGLVSIILKEGTGPSPAPTDTVSVHYTGWLLDGTKFDSSVDRGEPAKFPLNRVIKGWTEGVGLMKVGEKRKLIIPWEMAYGAQGRPPHIPPKAVLVFDVELLGIEGK